jgi:hypothetical protein
VSGQLHDPAALLTGKVHPVPIGWEVGWTLEPVWTTFRREHSWPFWDLNSDPSGVQSVASRYTDYVIPASSRKCESLRHLTTVWAYTACYRDSFTFFNPEDIFFITTAVRISNPTINQSNAPSQLSTGRKVCLGNLIVTRLDNKFNNFVKPKDPSSVHKNRKLNHILKHLNPAQNFNPVSSNDFHLLSHPREDLPNGQILWQNCCISCLHFFWNQCPQYFKNWV